MSGMNGAGQAMAGLFQGAFTAAGQLGQYMQMRRLKPLSTEGGQHGSAEWMSLEERIRRGLVWDQTQHPNEECPYPVLGATGGETWTDERGRVISKITGSFKEVYTGDAHLLTVARSGAGKSAANVIPECLRARGSLFITDAQGEIAMKTAAYREQMLGQAVYVIDPFKSVKNLPTSRFACYNPMDEIGRAKVPQSICMMLANALVPEKPGENNPFFSDSARSCLAGLLAFVGLDKLFKAGERNIRMVQSILTASAEDLAGIYKRMAESDVDLARVEGRKALSRLLGRDGQIQRDDVLATAWANTSIFIEEAILACMDRSDLDFSTFRDKPQTVYLCLPGILSESFARWQRLVMVSSWAAIERLGTITPGQMPIRYILDEFDSLGPFDRLKHQYTRSRGLGIQFWIFAQNLGQLEQNYGKNWETFIESAGVVQAFGGSSGFTAEYLCKQLGNRTIVAPSQNRSTVWGQGGPSAGYSESLMAQPLLTPDQMNVMQKHDQVLIHRGQGVAKAHLKFYYEERPWFDDWWQTNTLRARIPEIDRRTTPRAALPSPQPSLTMPVREKTLADLPKRVIRCPQCRQSLRVTAGRTGTVPCPNGHRVTVR